MEYSDFEMIYFVKESEEVFEKMVKKYEPLFKKIASSFYYSYKVKDMDIDDLVQYCRIVFCDVINRYDPNKSIMFYSYLLLCIKRSLSGYIKMNCSKEITYDINNYKDNKNYSIEDLSNKYIDYEYQQNIIKFKNSLSFIESQVFELKYNDFSYNDISLLLDINKKKVDNILVKIRKKMEKNFLFS